MSDLVINYARQQRGKYLNDLIEYLALPSVSAQPQHQPDVSRTAGWLSNHLRGIGMDARVMETGGHPVVYAEWLGAGAGRPTVLVYGHYDVQPAEPLELWHSDPFAAVVRDGVIYGRGSSDNKGQHMAHVKAVESFLAQKMPLPVNVKFLIEGEEEIGGPHLSALIAANKQLLACDVIMISDSALLAPDQPSLLYALRGLLYFEVEARCAAHDLHSGSYGGNVQNPAMALAQILARLKDEHGHVTVPSFYDAVRILDSAERAEIAHIPVSEQQIMAESGASQVFGEPGYNVAERMGVRPTLEVNGLWSGYTGEGAKTVLPATAYAKISCRLIPNQDPVQIYNSVVDYMRKLTPPGTNLSFKVLQQGARGTLIDRNAPQIQAAARAAQATYGKAPIYVLEGGSIPVVNDFQDVLGKPIALLGFGLSSDNIHAPDEHFPVVCYEKGIEASIRFMLEL